MKGTINAAPELGGVGPLDRPGPGIALPDAPHISPSFPQDGSVPGSGLEATKMKIEKEERDYIRARDRVCLYCKDSHGPFEIDHVKPRWRGGDNNPRNLVLSCYRCNQLKGGMSVAAFLSKMRLVEQGKLRIVRTGGAVPAKPFTFRKV